jgi:hypothetical protein
VLREGEQNRTVAIRFVSPPPQPPPVTKNDPTTASPRSTLLLPTLLAGVGVLGLATFAGVGLGANADLSALESSPCAAQRTCMPSDVDSVRTRYVVADVALVVGVVSLAAATIVWLGERGAR